MKKIFILIISTLFCLNYNKAQNIQTIAGTWNSPGFVDAVLATNAKLNQPNSIAVDKVGNYYIADKENSCIRKINASDGTIASIVGSPGNGAGAGYNQTTTTKRADQAQLNHPTSVIIDPSGRYLYIADADNYIIRMVDLSAKGGFPLIQNIAGTPRIAGSSGNNVQANTAELGGESYLALDKLGNLYISDVNNRIIRKVNTSGIITTVAGGGTNYIDNNISATSASIYPTGIAVDGNNDLFIADGVYLNIRKVTFNNNIGTIKTVVGNGHFICSGCGCPGGSGCVGGIGDGGIATSAELVYPTSVAVDENENIYICDWGDYRIRKVDYNTSIINTIVGGGSTNSENDGINPLSTQMIPPPYGIALDKCGNLLIAYKETHIIREVYNNILGLVVTPYVPFNGIIPQSTAIPNVTINITGDYTQSIVSNGNFFWSPPTGSGNYTITPTKPYIPGYTNSTNGVTTLDMALMQSAILGKVPFKSPYQYFAADVDNDGQITGLDIVYTKRLILGLPPNGTNYNIFPDLSNTGQYRLWAFIDVSRKFSNITDPFHTCIDCTPNPTQGYPNATNYSDCFSKSIYGTNCSASGVNFFGVKLGDVNNTWNPTIAKMAPVTFYHDNIDISNIPVGNNVTIPLKVKNFNGIITSQYTLNFNPNNLQYVGLENTDNQLDFNDINVGQGKLSFSWMDATVGGTNLADGTTLFNLIFKKQQAVTNQDITLTSDVTPVEVANSDFDLVPLVMNSGNITDTSAGAISDTTEIWKIDPSSSVKGNLFINANVNSAKMVTITISDVNGNLIYSTVRTLNQGSNVIYSNLRSAVNVPEGIYYVSISGLNKSVSQTLFVGEPDNVPAADAVAQGTIPGCNAALSIYALQAQLYIDIKTNTGLQNDAILQTFETQNATSNFAIIYSIDSALSTGDTITAIGLLNNFTPNNIIDSNYYSYYGWILKAIRNSLNSSDISAINALALSCPLTAGSVVYSARDLYNNIIGDNQVFTNACEVSSITLPAISSPVSAICMGNSTTFTDSYSGGIWSSDNSTIATVDSNGHITPITAGTTNIDYSITSSCVTTSVSAVITVNALPNATINGVSSLCANNPLIFNAGTSGGVWSSNATGIATVDATAGTVNGVNAGVAVISYAVTDNNGCSATASDSVTINALPNATITGASVLCKNHPVTFTDSTIGGVWLSNNSGIATIDSTTGIVSEVSVGIDTITYTVINTYGCTSTGTKIITVDTIPVATVSATPDPSCAGETITFTANSNDPNATYSWTGSGANPSPNTGTTVECVNPTGGTKTFTVTASNACGTGTKALSVVVNTLPSTPSISPSGSGGVITLAPCGTQVLTSSASSGNQWYIDGTEISGATGQTYTAGVGHGYSVTTTNSNGCTSNMSVAKSVQASTFSMSPNPAHTSVSVQGINVAEIDIINNVGTTVVTKIVNSGSGSSNTSISVSSLVAGSYTVTVKYNTGCYQSQTLIKN